MKVEKINFNGNEMYVVREAEEIVISDVYAKKFKLETAGTGKVSKVGAMLVDFTGRSEAVELGGNIIVNVSAPDKDVPESEENLDVYVFDTNEEAFAAFHKGGWFEDVHPMMFMKKMMNGFHNQFGKLVCNEGDEEILKKAMEQIEDHISYDYYKEEK